MRSTPPKRNAYGIGTDEKRILFVIIGATAIVLLISLVMGIITGYWSMFGSIVFIILFTAAMLGTFAVLWHLAKKIFPN